MLLCKYLDNLKNEIVWHEGRSWNCWARAVISKVQILISQPYCFHMGTDYRGAAKETTALLGNPVHPPMIHPHTHPSSSARCCVRQEEYCSGKTRDSVPSQSQHCTRETTVPAHCLLESERLILPRSTGLDIYIEAAVEEQLSFSPVGEYR